MVRAAALAGWSAVPPALPLVVGIQAPVPPCLPPRLLPPRWQGVWHFRPCLQLLPRGTLEPPPVYCTSLQHIADVLRLKLAIDAGEPPLSQLALSRGLEEFEDMLEDLRAETMEAGGRGPVASVVRCAGLVLNRQARRPGSRATSGPPQQPRLARSRVCAILFAQPRHQGLPPAKYRAQEAADTLLNA